MGNYAARSVWNTDISCCIYVKEPHDFTIGQGNASSQLYGQAFVCGEEGFQTTKKGLTDGKF